MFQRFRKIWKCQYCWPSYFNVSLHSFGRFQIFRKRRRPLERIFLKINEWSWNYMNNYQGISLIIHWFSGKSFNLLFFPITKDTWCMYIYIYYIYIYMCVITSILLDPFLSRPTERQRTVLGRWKISWPRCWSVLRAPGSQSSPDSPAARRFDGFSWQVKH